MAKIILISDIHLSMIDHDDVYDVDHISGKLTKSLSEEIYDPLFAALENEKEPADLIVFCGDYVLGRESEEKRRESYEAFVHFLEKIEKSKKILKIKNNKKSRIIIVPGNHDICRDSDEIYKEFLTHLNFYRTPFTRKVDVKTTPMFIFKNLKLIIDCEATEDNSSTLNEKIEKWINMVDSSDASVEQKREIIEELRRERIEDIPSVPVSASSRFKDTANKLFSSGCYDDYLKIMVSHHPLLSGIETGKTIKRYNYTVGGFDFMKTAMEYGFQLFIHGHIHEQSCIEITDYNGDKPCSCVQLGVPNLKRDISTNGIIVIDTQPSKERSWPFSIILKTLSSSIRGFRQVAVFDGIKTISKCEDDNMTVLVDRDITALIDEGKIIKNGDRDRVEAASYDCALGYEYKRASVRYCDWSSVEKSSLVITESNSGIEIAPHESVLIYTYEEFDVPKDMILHASPISSWLRKGLRVEISHFVDPGFKGAFCFPVINETDRIIKISAREPIMSIEFIKLSKSCEKDWSERHSDKASRREKRED